MIGLLGGSDINKRAGNDLASEIFDLFGLEFYETVDHGKKGVILATFDVLSGMELGATLTDDDVANRNGLVAIDFHAETLGNGITAEGG